jgi:hypothetical protein
MPDRISEHINRQLREVRARSFSPDDSAGINAAIREAAGRGPIRQPAADPDDDDDQQHTPGDPRTASRYLLAEAAEAVRDSEPVPGLDPEGKWDQWAHSRPVVTLLDQAGRLPGERGYRANTTGHAVGGGWDFQAAIDARKHRWQSLGR